MEINKHHLDKYTDLNEKTKLKILRALSLLELSNKQKKYYDDRGYTPENHKAYEVLDYMLEESKKKNE